MPEIVTEALPTDADIDLHVPAQRREFLSAPASVLAAISLGGAVGSLCRWGIGTAFPAPPDGFPWATFMINVSGCLLIGVLMVLVTEVFTEQRLLRPFLGVGVMGGYTTFSTYIVDSQRLITNGRAALALAYLGATLVAALCAAALGIGATRWVIRTRSPVVLPNPRGEQTAGRDRTVSLLLDEGAGR